MPRNINLKNNKKGDRISLVKRNDAQTKVNDYLKNHLNEVFTEEKLAEESGVSQPTVSRALEYIQGATQYSYKKIYKYSIELCEGGFKMVKRRFDEPNETNEALSKASPKANEKIVHVLNSEPSFADIMEDAIEAIEQTPFEKTAQQIAELNVITEEEPERITATVILYPVNGKKTLKTITLIKALYNDAVCDVVKCLSGLYVIVADDKAHVKTWIETRNNIEELYKAAYALQKKASSKKPNK